MRTLGRLTLQRSERLTNGTKHEARCSACEKRSWRLKVLCMACAFPQVVCIEIHILPQRCIGVGWHHSPCHRNNGFGVDLFGEPRSWFWEHSLKAFFQRICEKNKCPEVIIRDVPGCICSHKKTLSSHGGSDPHRSKLLRPYYHAARTLGQDIYAGNYLVIPGLHCDTNSFGSVSVGVRAPLGPLLPRVNIAEPGNGALC